MIIRSLKRNYKVIRKIKVNSDNTHLICSDAASGNIDPGVISDNRNVLLYDIAVMKKIKKRPELIEYFNELLAFDGFHDFVECFQNNQYFYVVLIHREGRSLNERLHKESFEMPERLKIGRALMEQMVLQNTPFYLMQEGMHKNHVIMTDSNQIHFRYSLVDVENHDQYMLSDVCEQIDYWVVQLFREELRKKICPELLAFRSKLRKGFHTYMEIYEAFLEVCKRLLAIHESGVSATSMSLMNRIVKKMKKFYRKYHMTIGISLLLLLALFSAGLILYTKYHISYMNEGIGHIGTVEIKDHEGNEEQEGGEE